ncbi:NmrA family protein [Comamonas testosteroni]|uniref:NmrA family protein n=1 Tax=Comamonas testosteroni TaxID=285 RepID=A0A0L7MFD8_COMTE|nr:NAD(P)H-binding protein [Comamonas testosteroni]KOC20624.1 NmrA family protein [Comamonas testosteroni]KWT73589.1 hypothetical protein APV28_0988 [Comamonas testosteroni]
MSKRAEPRVLVSGASGRLGQLLVPRLLARHARVRVLVRCAATARSLWGDAVEIAEASFDEQASLCEASAGADSLFLLSPIGPALAAQQSRVIEAAQTAGLSHIVKLSGSDWTINPSGLSLSGDAHGHVEQFLQDSGISHVVLRPNAWMQVGLSRVAGDLREGDAIRCHHIGAAVSYIDARDIADVAVQALLNQRLVRQMRERAPGPWVLTGGQAVGAQQLAQIASYHLSRQIRVEAPLPALAQDPFIARVHGQFFALMNEGHAAAVTDTVRLVLGREPRNVADFLAEQLRAVPIAPLS